MYLFHAYKNIQRGYYNRDSSILISKDKMIGEVKRSIFRVLKPETRCPVMSFLAFVLDLLKVTTSWY